MYPNTGSGEPPAEEAVSSSQEEIMLIVPTQHLFAWIDKHREVLQKLHSEGEAFSASQPLLAM